MTDERVTDQVVVAGPQAESYLQGQLSQDIAALKSGDTATALLLEPTGKMGFWLQVERTADDTFVLAVDAGQGEAVLERLNRFKLRTKVMFELQPGSGSRDELERILAGRPRHGTEIVAGETIPAELGQQLIDGSVSFTKGCYTGQELVARIDARGGHVPRHLRRLTFAATGPDALPEPGTELLVDSKVVGRLTSVAWSSDDQQAVALGFVGRAVDVPGRVELAGFGPAEVSAVREG